ncbi:MAG: DoxX family protein [Rhodobiaceae bacterium]|nr:DoxX family protein [Rhodobiaceae bacterium]
MSQSVQSNSLAGTVRELASWAIALSERTPAWIYQLAMRIAIGMVFWQSARTKVEGVLTLKQSTFFLFQYEYDLPLIPADIAAYMATYAETGFAILLIIGLATRFAAASLLVMTLVIQIFVYPEAWVVHLSWMAILTYLMARGGGLFSADHLVKKAFMRD